MKSLKSITFICFVLVVLNLDDIDSNQDSDIIMEYFENWQVKYNRTFTSETEKLNAFKNFERNFKTMMLQRIKYFKRNSQFLVEMNARACDEDKRSWTGAKFTGNEKMLLSHRVLIKKKTYPKPPESLDYRELGMVTPVEDQGLTCSSCYAFAATCGIEGQIAKKYGKLISLSKQMFVDCSSKCGNFGCDGGFIETTYNYVAKCKGIANETAYPYTGSIQDCQYDGSQFSAKISSYEFVNGDEEYLKSVLAAVGPLPVGMRGSLNSFYYYSSGIYDDSACNDDLDHAVCIVGYGTDNSTVPPTNYWIIKNSWSTEWGEKGYFRLKMGSNLCGIRNYVVYPII